MSSLPRTLLSLAARFLLRPSTDNSDLGFSPMISAQGQGGFSSVLEEARLVFNTSLPFQSGEKGDFSSL